MNDKAAAPRSRGVRVLGCGFVALFVLLVLLAAVAYFGLQSKPTHWTDEQQRLAALPDAQRRAISESLRNRLITQWSDPGDKTPLTEADLFGHRQVIEIPFDDLNTWIQTEGVSLLNEVDLEIPDAVSMVMVDSPGQGRLRFSFELKTDSLQQVIALSFATSIDHDGALTSTLTSATAGRLPLPVNSAIDLVRREGEGGILLDLMLGNPLPPIIVPIDAGEDGLRDGKIIDLEVHEDALIITRQTVRRRRAD